MQDHKMINILIDSLNAVYHELKKGRYQNIAGQLADLEMFNAEHSRISIGEFNIISHLAKGAYGEVFVAERNSKVYAIKRIMKHTIVQQPFTALFMAEKDLMVDSRNSEWLLYAHYTFQDEEAVYFAMDFLPGGDFMGYLVKNENVSEGEIRFYGAEIVCAMEELHALGYLHRDLKPENLLIERSGHIKLADFGSCIKMTLGKVKCCATVGTPDYVSPDVLSGTGTEFEYGAEVDLWTLGVVLYEMLYEAPPFYSETLQETYERITNIDYTFPAHGSDVFKDLVRGLLCKKDERLTIADVKQHAFFSGVDWKTIKTGTPPYVPELDSDVDLRNFERPEKSSSALTDTEINKTSEGHFLNFVGFSFDPDYSQFLINKLNRGRADEGPITAVVTKETTVSVCKYPQAAEPVKKEMRDAEVLLRHGRIAPWQLESMREATVLCVPASDAFTSVLRTKLRLDNSTTDEDPKSALLRRLHEQKISANRLVGMIKMNMNDIGPAFAGIMVENRNLRLDIHEIMSQNDLLISSLNQCTLEIKALKEKNLKVQFYKRELRIKRTEVKEFQQKLESEIVAKNRMEDEVIFLKKEVERLSRRNTVERRLCFRTKVLDVAGGSLTTEIVIENQQFKMLDHESNINNVFITPLKTNELFHMAYKERNLTLCIVIVEEVSRCSTPTPKTNTKMLEDAIQKEENIQQGIEKIMKISSKKVIEDAKVQLEGSRKRLSYLKSELEKSRRQTDVACEEYADNVHRYEYNNHIFITKTFPPQTLCEYCNDVMRGIKDQGLECADCKMVVHRNCYVLSDVSCEMHHAMSKGNKYHVIMRSMVDKEKLLMWSKA